MLASADEVPQPAASPLRRRVESGSLLSFLFGATLRHVMGRFRRVAVGSERRYLVVGLPQFHG
jgi:hypothetical protein